MNVFPGCVVLLFPLICLSSVAGNRILWPVGLTGFRATVLRVVSFALGDDHDRCHGVASLECADIGVPVSLVVGDVVEVVASFSEHVVGDGGGDLRIRSVAGYACGFGEVF